MAAVTLTIILFFTSLCCLLSTVSCRMIVVGQATEIADVKVNKEVQELGKFAVEKYNEGLRLWQIHFNGGGEEVQGQEKLQFEEVVEAKQQVVSGTKYYLKISASTKKTENDVPKMFTSVVVVKPWLCSKQLLHFGPYLSSSSSSR
ncbi:hypothetical protein PIB30_046589 [Stylosanthes scabra]|uniref:Cystatin domain-containing protein n=1 Tax=Stylosanthes scabra TaxID=79078 RepID=A0ABU6QGR6_9FABA|nr:hypothetical protein [Stylosanthes scabra]